MKKIAMIVSALDGGVAQFLYNYISNFDLSKIQIDIIAQSYPSKMYKKKFVNLNITLLQVPDKSSILNYTRKLYKIFKLNKYDIVHAHLTQYNCFPLGIAKFAKIKRRISHSHMAEKKQFINNIFIYLTNCFATDRLACGENAGRYLYGNNTFIIFKNAIDIYKYRFNQEVAEQERKKFNISKNSFVLGNIGRLTNQKNQIFVIDLFLEYKKNNKNSKLIIIGKGEKEKEIREYIEKKNLHNDVIIISEVEDVYNKIQMFNVFVLPSLYEGLPIVGIEAQAVGIPCYFSDTIDKSIRVGSNVYFLNISNAMEWAIAISKHNKKVENNINKLIASGFDIRTEASKLEEYYIKDETC